MLPLKKEPLYQKLRKKNYKSLSPEHKYYGTIQRSVVHEPSHFYLPARIVPLW